MSDRALLNKAFELPDSDYNRIDRMARRAKQESTKSKLKRISEIKKKRFGG